MLFTINTTEKTAEEVAPVTLSSLQLYERYDLQEWVLQNPLILGEPLLVVTSEFDRFDRTSERLDVLALDQRGKLVVVELKRSAVGTAAELQALRYAAYCSTMSLHDVAEELAAHLSRRRDEPVSVEEAGDIIQGFVNEPDFQELDNQPRVLLAAEEFSAEITATVLWLRTFNVDITCVRLRPYVIGEQLVVDSTVLIPLPEAREYQIRREWKEAERRIGAAPNVQSPEEFLARVSAEVRPLLEDLRRWVLSHGGVTEEVFKTVMTYRRTSDREWITWLQSTRYEARAAVSPDLDIDPTLVVRRTPSGWPILRARTEDELQQIKDVLARALSGVHANVAVHRPDYEVGKDGAHQASDAL